MVRRGRAGWFVWLAALPATASAHGSELDGARLARAWTWDPWLLALLVVSAAAYAAGYTRVRAQRGGVWPRGRRQVLCFALGWLSLLLALLSPLDYLSDRLFSAHMAQHELLMLVAAPLLVWARPLEPYLWALPARFRQPLAAALGHSALRRGWQIVTAPALALLVHALVRWLWHVPVLFEAALVSPWVHALQHFGFFATAVLFWWAVMMGRYGRLGYGVSVVFVFATALHTGALGALISLAGKPWYPRYAAEALRLSLDALADQQLAGLIMWIAAGGVCTSFGVALFAAWLLAWQSRSRARARARHAATLTLVASLGLALAAVGCRSDDERLARALTGGRPSQGRSALERYGCGSCHEIPGVPRARGTVGPSLARLSLRGYLAGRLPNQPQHLIAWITHPQAVEPGNAMPDLDVTPEDAKDMAAYLYTLR